MKFPILVAIIASISIFAAACGSDTAATVTGATDTTTTTTTVAEVEPDSDTDSDAGEHEGEDSDAGEHEGEDADADSMEGPTRIVSLSPTATEMLFAIGAGDLVVAADQFSNYPAEAPTTDLDGWQPNVEAIAGFEPDLVVTQSPIEGLQAIGIENLALPSATVIDDVYAQIEQLGVVTGHVGDAAEVVSQMQIGIADFLASLPERDKPLTYYHEVDTTLYTVTSSTFIGQVYDMLGLVNVADPADPDGESFGYPQLNAEFLIDANPDIIFLADTLFEGQNVDSLAARPGWDQLSAVQSGRVVELNDDIASRWGPRILDFIEVAAFAVAEVEVAAV